MSRQLISRKSKKTYEKPYEQATTGNHLQRNIAQGPAWELCHAQHNISNSPRNEKVVLQIPQRIQMADEAKLGQGLYGTVHVRYGGEHRTRAITMVWRRGRPPKKADKRQKIADVGDERP